MNSERLIIVSKSTEDSSANDKIHWQKVNETLSKRFKGSRGILTMRDALKFHLLFFEMKFDSFEYVR